MTAPGKRSSPALSSRPASCPCGSPPARSSLVAAIIAPHALQNTSWAYVLPYMTVLAIAALGQMLVIMQAGIDLSTPGVISFGGNLIVGVSLGRTTGWRSDSSPASASAWASAS